MTFYWRRKMKPVLLLVTVILVLVPTLVTSQDATDKVAETFRSENIPGVPGQDYTIFNNVPTSSFSCRNHEFPGYYADTEVGCQVFHICQEGGKQDSFLCPNGTVFNQMYFVCDWWFNFHCDQAAQFYSLNANLYKERGPNLHDGLAEILDPASLRRGNLRTEEASSAVASQPEVASSDAVGRGQPATSVSAAFASVTSGSSVTPRTTDFVQRGTEPPTLTTVAQAAATASVSGDGATSTFASAQGFTRKVVLSGVEGIRPPMTMDETSHLKPPKTAATFRAPRPSAPVSQADTSGESFSVEPQHQTASTPFPFLSSRQPSGRNVDSDAGGYGFDFDHDDNDVRVTTSLPPATISLASTAVAPPTTPSPFTTQQSFHITSQPEIFELDVRSGNSSPQPQIEITTPFTVSHNIFSTPPPLQQTTFSSTFAPSTSFQPDLDVRDQPRVQLTPLQNFNPPPPPAKNILDINHQSDRQPQLINTSFDPPRPSTFAPTQQFSQPQRQQELIIRPQPSSIHLNNGFNQNNLNQQNFRENQQIRHFDHDDHDDFRDNDDFHDDDPDHDGDDIRQRPNLQQGNNFPVNQQQGGNFLQNQQQGNNFPQNQQQGNNIPQTQQQGNINFPQNQQQGNNFPQNQQQGNNLPQNQQQGNNLPQNQQQRNINNIPHNQQQGNNFPQNQQQGNNFQPNQQQGNFQQPPVQQQNNEIRNIQGSNVNNFRRPQDFDHDDHDDIRPDIDDIHDDIDDDRDDFRQQNNLIRTQPNIRPVQNGQAEIQLNQNRPLTDRPQNQQPNFRPQNQQPNFRPQNQQTNFRPQNQQQNFGLQNQQPNFVVQGQPQTRPNENLQSNFQQQQNSFSNSEQQHEQRQQGQFQSQTNRPPPPSLNSLQFQTPLPPLSQSSPFRDHDDHDDHFDHDDHDDHFDDDRRPQNLQPGPRPEQQFDQRQNLRPQQNFQSEPIPPRNFQVNSQPTQQERVSTIETPRQQNNDNFQQNFISSPKAPSSEFAKPPTSTPSRFQSSTAVPPQFFQSSTPPPPQFFQSLSPRPPQFFQSSTPPPPQFFQSSTPSPPQFFQSSTPAPPQFFQHSTPSPQQFFPPSTPSPPQFFQSSTPRPSQILNSNAQLPSPRPLPPPPQASRDQQFRNNHEENFSTVTSRPVPISSSTLQPVPLSNNQNQMNSAVFVGSTTPKPERRPIFISTILPSSQRPPNRQFSDREPEDNFVREPKLTHQPMALLPASVPQFAIIAKLRPPVAEVGPANMHFVQQMPVFQQNNQPIQRPHVFQQQSNFIRPQSRPVQQQHFNEQGQFRNNNFPQNAPSQQDFRQSNQGRFPPPNQQFNSIHSEHNQINSNQRPLENQFFQNQIPIQQPQNARNINQQFQNQQFISSTVRPANNFIDNSMQRQNNNPTTGQNEHHVRFEIPLPERAFISTTAAPLSQIRFMSNPPPLISSTPRPQNFQVTTSRPIEPFRSSSPPPHHDIAPQRQQQQDFVRVSSPRPLNFGSSTLSPPSRPQQHQPFVSSTPRPHSQISQREQSPNRPNDFIRISSPPPQHQFVSPSSTLAPMKITTFSPPVGHFISDNSVPSQQEHMTKLKGLHVIQPPKFLGTPPPQFQNQIENQNFMEQPRLSSTFRPPTDNHIQVSSPRPPLQQEVFFPQIQNQQPNQQQQLKQENFEHKQPEIIFHKFPPNIQQNNEAPHFHEQNNRHQGPAHIELQPPQRPHHNPEQINFIPSSTSRPVQFFPSSSHAPLIPPNNINNDIQHNRPLPQPLAQFVPHPPSNRPPSADFVHQSTQRPLPPLPIQNHNNVNNQFHHQDFHEVKQTQVFNNHEFQRHNNHFRQNENKEFHQNENKEFHQNENKEFHQNENKEFHQNENKEFHQNENKEFHQNENKQIHHSENKQIHHNENKQVPHNENKQFHINNNNQLQQNNQPHQQQQHFNQHQQQPQNVDQQQQQRPHMVFIQSTAPPQGSHHSIFNPNQQQNAHVDVMPPVFIPKTKQRPALEPLTNNNDRPHQFMSIQNNGGQNLSPSSNFQRPNQANFNQQLNNNQQRPQHHQIDFDDFEPDDHHDPNDHDNHHDDNDHVGRPFFTHQGAPHHPMAFENFIPEDSGNGYESYGGSDEAQSDYSSFVQQDIAVLKYK